MSGTVRGGRPRAAAVEWGGPGDRRLSHHSVCPLTVSAFGLRAEGGMSHPGVGGSAPTGVVNPQVKLWLAVQGACALMFFRTPARVAGPVAPRPSP